VFAGGDVPFSPSFMYSKYGFVFDSTQSPQFPYCQEYHEAPFGISAAAIRLLFLLRSEVVNSQKKEPTEGRLRAKNFK